ncbi:MAG: type II secretion system protein M [Hyphomonadaceae bacterium]|nr:type II secretion system protein M [Hyphomonadaceae bacterium]
MIQSILDSWTAFWRARTAREQLILKGGAVIVFGVLLPFMAFQSASAFRAKAGNDLKSAREVQANVRRLAAQGSAPTEAASDGSLRGIAFALAQANGLTVSRIETAGPDRIRIALEPADSLKVYRWIDALSRRGAALEKTELRRIGAQGGVDQVAAEFEIALERRPR